MKVWSLAALISVTLAQVLVSAETNGLPPELVAQIRVREHQLTAMGYASVVTNALKNEGKLLHMVEVSDFGVQTWVVGEEGKREGSFDGGLSRKLPEALKDLTSGELKRLSAALPELPAGRTNLGTNRTIIVGFRSGTNWLTRIYDGSEEPAALRKVRRIINPPPSSENTK